MQKIAGVLIPLFSLRASSDFGIGEILHLPAMVDFVLAMGHSAIQLLPLGETSIAEASPYSAMSAFSIDPLFISGAGLRGVSGAIRNSRKIVGIAARFVPRDRVRSAKSPLLELAWSRFKDRGARSHREGFEAFQSEHRGWLQDYSLFRALKERFDWRSWEEWPEAIRRREPEALFGARAAMADQVGMYSYFQFLAFRQWLEARVYAEERGVLLGGDLAFSPARDSADVWANQHIFRLDRFVGAPPDAFNARGQRWGLPMPDWNKMREDNFAWWRMRIRHSAMLYDLIRLDHVVGVFRTYSFPADPAAAGEFFPADENAQHEQGEAFLKMVLEEVGASRLIAEDLGTIPPFVRQSLTRNNVPGFKVLRWEKQNWDTPQEHYVPPQRYPELAVATTGTHDTTTVLQWWRDTSLKERRQLVVGLALDGQVNPRLRYLNLQSLDAILAALYRAPSEFVLTPIQDLFGWTARINTPGTVTDRNWHYRLPLTFEKLRASRAITSQQDQLKKIATISDRLPRA